MTYNYLNPENAFIWRIVRREDIGWLLEDGLHCKNDIPTHRNYQSMGNNQLISERGTKDVPIGAGGTLNDYVPFYFTPFSIMMLNIHTGHNEITMIDNKDIVILVASLHELTSHNIKYVFTDQHAYASNVSFYSELSSLEEIDWTILQNRDFSYSQDYPDKKVRYQAEVLVYKNLPIEYLKAIVCYNEEVKSEIQNHLDRLNIKINVCVAPEFYWNLNVRK